MRREMEGGEGGKGWSVCMREIGKEIMKEEKKKRKQQIDVETNKIIEAKLGQCAMHIVRRLLFAVRCLLFFLLLFSLIERKSNRVRIESSNRMGWSSSSSLMKSHNLREVVSCFVAVTACLLPCIVRAIALCNHLGEISHNVSGDLIPEERTGVHLGG